jgi:hypothetical protein
MIPQLLRPIRRNPPFMLINGRILVEEDLILCKTEKDDTSWCLAEVSKIFPDEVEVAY